ncbi:glycosyl transferase [Thermanaerothrix daxensis]|uniref:Glycosyl transferase n=1 Tax=Thermanaerothrix daxensis TaxID=869279 RepID=A0A0P6XG27_9CHLR|nr:polyprenol monophosphomannose synthase [Thermanaerothrix daxensis]KPL82385.1 glycosyl transferase [Thermanaerothrix daxensis]
MRLTLVIPTYNEAENLPLLAETLFALPLPDLRLLVVDDASPDGTGQIAEGLNERWPGRVRVLHRPGKLGLGTAYIQGFRLAMEEADAVGQMDADFSHPPAKVVELVTALETCDLAIGSRYVPGGSLDERWPFWRRWLSGFGNAYARVILGLPVRDATGGFRLWRREALERLPLERVRSNGYVFQVEMAYLAYLHGLRIREIPIHFADRRWGQSKMNLRIQIEAAYRVWLLLRQYADLRHRRVAHQVRSSSR